MMTWATHPKSRSIAGVTLVEFLVVMSILAIAMTFVAPSLSNGIDGLTLNSAGRRVVSAFRTAQADARLSQREVIGVFANGEFTFWKSDKQIASLVLPSEVRIEAAEPEVSFTFLTSGQVLGPSSLQLVTAGGRRGVLSIGPTPGKVAFGEAQ